MYCVSLEQDIYAKVKQLQKNHLLFEDRHYQCFLAYGHELGEFLKTIGQERSQAFQGLGMGSETFCELDRFDPHYLQVILWHREKEQIIGGYRIALVEDFVQTMGWSSLYLNEDYYPLANLLMSDGKTFELSRAFIAPTYQKKSLTLFMLWKGVLQAFAKFPNYRYVIGAASLSQQEVNIKAQQLFIACLRHGPFADHTRGVKARTSYQGDSELPDHLLSVCKQELTFDEINAFISHETKMPFKAPELFRYYTEHFNARCLTYAVDKKFNSIDILQWAALNQMSETLKKIINR